MDNVTIGSDFSEMLRALFFHQRRKKKLPAEMMVLSKFPWALA